MIYAIGDSFTYGDELSSRDLAWPALLSKKLNIPVENKGRCATGNHRMVKRVIDAVLEKSELIIVGWSDCHRQEFADEIGIYDIWAGRNAEAFQLEDPTHRITLIKYLTAYDFSKYYYANWLRQIILIQNLCRANNIPLVMFIACASNKSHYEFHSEFRALVNAIDISCFVDHDMMKSVGDWIWGTKLMPNRHPSEDGHKIIADKIYEHIRNIGWFS